MILLVITGGGIIRWVLQNAGMGDIIGPALEKSGLPLILVAFLIAALIRSSVGAAVVAMTMSAGIMASMPAVQALSPVELAAMVCAINGGATAFSHVNDSGFWLVGSLLEIDEKSTLKSWTIMETIIGVVGLPKQDTGILQVHSDDPNICTLFLEELEHLGILCPEGPMIQKTTFLACALGEMLIDFTMQGRNEQGQRVFAQNAGGAPANVMAAMAKLGARTAFIGKAGNDMHGRFLKETLEQCGIDSTGFTLSDDYFTTLAFVDVKPDGEREFSFARNHGAERKKLAV